MRTIQGSYRYLLDRIHAWIIILFVFATGCGHSPKNPFLEGLPLKGFEQAGPLTVYNKTTLFDYVNGEAEVFLPLGFTLLYTQTYQRKETGVRTMVEVYDMRSREGATSVLKKFVQDGGSQSQDLGESRWMGNGVVLFQRGRYYVKMFSDPSPENEVKPTLPDLFSLGRLIDDLLREDPR
jgi:hypothetical protein